VIPSVLRRVTLQSKVERHFERSLRREPERHRLGAAERAPHQPGARQQDHRHRHLHDDQRVAPRDAAPLARGSRVLEDAREINLRALQCRHQAEHHGGHEREDDAEQQDARVERKVEHDRNVDRQPHRACRTHQPPGEHQARHPRQAREHEALDEQLPDERDAAGADRQPYRNFVTPIDRAREQQICEVHTCEQQHEARDDEQEPGEAEHGPAHHAAEESRGRQHDPHGCIVILIFIDVRKLA
jgi:hypothetical protein